jgi:hypothetical protein
MTVLPNVHKLPSNDQCSKYKMEIHKDYRQLGIKFTLNKTISEFICASEKLNMDYVTSFDEFGNVLLGHYQTNWKQVLHEHFPEPVNPEVVEPVQDRALAENFSCVINLFLIRTLNNKNPGIASITIWHLVGTMASTRSSSRALWTISIV